MSKGGGAHGRLHRLFGEGPWTCLYCGCGVVCSCQREPFTLPPHSATLEHKVPLTRGGSNDRSNIAVACRQCNVGKGNRIYPTEWIPAADLNTWVQVGVPVDRVGRLWEPLSLRERGIIDLLGLFAGPDYYSIDELANLVTEDPSSLRQALQRFAGRGFVRRRIVLGRPVRHVYDVVVSDEHTAPALQAGLHDDAEPVGTGLAPVVEGSRAVGVPAVEAGQLAGSL